MLLAFSRGPKGFTHRKNVNVFVPKSRQDIFGKSPCVWDNVIICNYLNY